MAGTNWQQVKDTFQQALRLNPGERDRFLNNACGEDIGLRIEVESLLISLTEAQSFLEEPVIGGPHEHGGWQLGEEQKISHYRIISPIASGGMGEVYLARDEQLNRNVALKVLPPDLLENKQRLRRFQREANVVSALNHPNILTVHEFGSDQGLHFLASEFVKGETLRARLEAGPLGLPAALDIAVQAVSALKAAHAAGVVHRDVTPENLMIRDDGYVKILDFGLAKPTEGPDAAFGANAQFLSRPGIIMGTLTYMSPEQARGGAVDARSDLFSFGVVFYEMLTGRVPFEGQSKADVLAAIIQLSPRPASLFLPNLPAEADRIIERCLEKNKQDRYSNADELLADLKHLLKQIESPRPAYSEGTDTEPKPPAAHLAASGEPPGASRPSPAWLIAAAAAVMLALAAIAIAFFALPSLRR